MDPSAHRVEVPGGDLTYDSVLLATGASPRGLPIEGHDLPGVHTLRTIDDSDRLAEALRGGGRRLVLIGSGWIGMEVAATARTLGNEVTVLERDEVPLAAAVGPGWARCSGDSTSSTGSTCARASTSRGSPATAAPRGSWSTARRWRLIWW